MDKKLNITLIKKRKKKGLENTFNIINDNEHTCTLYQAFDINNLSKPNITKQNSILHVSVRYFIS